jgi:hypothetical protein
MFYQGGMIRRTVGDAHISVHGFGRFNGLVLLYSLEINPHRVVPVWICVQRPDLPCPV